MKLDKVKLLKEITKNPRIAKEIKEKNLNAKQMEEALPILIDMNNQNKDDEYLISFYVTPMGNVKRTQVLSKHGKKKSFKSNIMTLDIFPINFEESKEFVRDNERKLLLAEFSKFIKSDVSDKGLYIYGPMGVGKSFITKRFVKKLAEYGKKVGLVSLPELVGKVKSTFGAAENKKHDNWQETLKTVDILFIDDIGAESITSWFRDDFLFSILNSRMEMNKATFFTSNYSYEDLEKIESRTTKQKYREIDKAKRLVNRIKTLTKPIALNGINRRY